MKASETEGHVVLLPPGYTPAGDWSTTPQPFSVHRVLETRSDPDSVYLSGLYTDDPAGIPDIVFAPADMELEVIE